MEYQQEIRIKKPVKSRNKQNLKSRIVFAGSDRSSDWDIQADDGMSQAYLNKLRQGVIWAEILGRPVSKRSGRGRHGL